MTANDLSGEVFYPSKEIVKKANSKNYVEMAKFASDDLEGFWAKEAKNLHWFKNGIKYLTIPKNHFINGLSEVKLILLITVWTFM